MSAGKLRAELKRLSSATKQNIFEMLRVASELLQSEDFLAQYKGEPEAVDDLEANEFSHFGGRPKLRTMLLAYRKNPSITEWRRHGFNIQVMIDLATPQVETEATERKNWKAECARLTEALASAKAVADEQSKTISELRAKIDEQHGLIGELRGELKSYQRRGAMA